MPRLLHVCGNDAPQPRLAGLAQGADVGATLLDWFGVKEDGQPFDGQSVFASLESGDCTLRELAVSEGDNGERSIRTPAWMLRKDKPDGQQQLFAKADDRWECNDIAALCPEVVDRLCAKLADFEKQCSSEKSVVIETLDDELVRPSR